MNEGTPKVHRCRHTYFVRSSNLSWGTIKKKCQTYSKITISYVDDVTICAAAGGESLESLTTEEMENLKEKLHCHEMGFAIDKTKT